MVRRRPSSTEPPVTDALLDEARGLSRPLRFPADLDPLLERCRNARVVLLGEASHGTREFYTWRTAVTKRLVEEQGFSFVAAEGDWPDCYRVNRFAKGYPGAAADAEEALEAFRRWPTWMWANEEVLDLVGRLRRHNAGRPERERVGFYGLDVYSLWDSLREVMGYLRTADPKALDAAWRAVRCFEPYGEDAQEYARATALVPDACCRDAVAALLRRLRAAAEGRDGDGPDGRFVAEQNALVIKNAEAYYRAMVRSDGELWNVRDRHMAETLDRLLAHHGPDSKVVVWEHNTHIGDARFTDMADDGMVNLGQLARERYGLDGVVIAGFGSYRGAVIAGRHWGAPWEEMRVPPGRDGSWEDVLHRAGAGDALLVFRPPASEAFSAWRGHRAIGVVYRPQYEQYGNYVPTVLPERYDAFLYLDRTTAVRPLFPPAAEDPEELPETFPSGV
ncbi:erythromycin esterase family protein [Gemmata sp.]|uniref:erythromycin esterase family protein n=1 Tax=Gemmata sp. TaxID=1914242 RepID=UPI003F6FEE16